MATIELKAERREGTGKGIARKIRRNGRIPSVVYRGGEVSTPITIDPQELELKFQRSGNPNTLVSLDVGDAVRTCLVRDVQRHPVSGSIEHVDFYEVSDDQEVVVDVPVEAVGRAAGVRAGGKLQIIQRTLRLRSRPGDIPATVPVDVTDVEVGQFVRASKIPAPPNTRLVITQDSNVISVIGKRGGAAAAPAAAAAGAPAAAAGAKKG